LVEGPADKVALVTGASPGIVWLVDGGYCA
jgi:hypothetical protein